MAREPLRTRGESEGRLLLSLTQSRPPGVEGVVDTMRSVPLNGDATRRKLIDEAARAFAAEGVSTSL